MVRFFGGRTITLYASGTAALSQAIARCATRASVAAPEVILPAYGCPDLVSACIHASVYPRLVEVGPSAWSYDFDSLKATITRNTVAVVAVNLLGIGDGSSQLIALCRAKGIQLIQDSAQYLPREAIDWPGDYVVLSFGRGKPLNLLHGGALIESTQGASKFSVASSYTFKDRLLGSRAAAIAFNCTTRPRPYRFFSCLPGTGIGEVNYEPLSKARLLPHDAWNRVGSAFDLYREQQSYRRKIWTPAIDEWSPLGIFALECPGCPTEMEPLRLALLAPDRRARDTLVHSLIRRGLGASRLYGTDLTNIAGIPSIIRRQGPFPRATSLADRLFTLPTHHLVSVDTVQSAREVVRAWLRSRDAIP